MNHRSHRPAEERQARSRLAHLISEQPFLRGSFQQRARSCGKPSCRCQKGRLHRSLYLATRHNGRRILLYIPRALEDTVRQWVSNGRLLHQQLQDLHQIQLDGLLQRKKETSSQRRKTKQADQPDRSP